MSRVPCSISLCRGDSRRGMLSFLQSMIYRSTPHNTFGTAQRSQILWKDDLLSRVTRRCAVSPPFFRGDFPYLAGQASADVIAFLDSNEAHARLLGNPARCRVRGGLGDAQRRETEHVEPVVRHRFHRLGHQALAAPGGGEPETAIVIVAPLKR